MERPRLLNGDVIAGIVLTALGAYVTTTATSWPVLDADGPGPGFFPIIYGIALIVGALALIVFAFKRRADEKREPIDWIGVGRALAAWGGLVLMIPVMKYLGFAIAFGALILFFGRVIFQSSWRMTVASAILVPLGFQLLFPMLLQVQLPVGMWTGF